MHTRGLEGGPQGTRVHGRSCRSHRTGTDHNKFSLPCDPERTSRKLNSRPPKETGAEDVYVDVGSTGRTHSQRQSSTILPGVRMVDPSPVMGHDAFQRPSWPHSNRRACDGQLNDSKTDTIEDDRR